MNLIGANLKNADPDTFARALGQNARLRAACMDDGCQASISFATDRDSLREIARRLDPYRAVPVIAGLPDADAVTPKVPAPIRVDPSWPVIAGAVACAFLNGVLFAVLFLVHQL